MRKVVLGILVLVLALSFLALAQNPTPPQSFVIKAANGNILFPHAKHVAAENNKCATCHPKMWPMNRTAPIGFRPPHIKEEQAQTSCGTCHRPSGPAFAANVPANCKKCHGTAPKS